MPAGHLPLVWSPGATHWWLECSRSQGSLQGGCKDAEGWGGSRAREPQLRFLEAREEASRRMNEWDPPAHQHTAQACPGPQPSALTEACSCCQQPRQCHQPPQHWFHTTGPQFPICKMRGQVQTTHSISISRTPTVCQASDTHGQWGPSSSHPLACPCGQLEHLPDGSPSGTRRGLDKDARKTTW